MTAYITEEEKSPPGRHCGVAGCVSVYVCVWWEEVESYWWCLGAYLLKEMVARHATRWRGEPAD